MRREQTSSKVESHLNVGLIISDYLDLNDISRNELARRMGLSRQQIYRILKSPTLYTDIVDRIGKCVNHNFFADLISDNSEKQSKEEVSQE